MLKRDFISEYEALPIKLGEQGWKLQVLKFLKNRVGISLGLMDFNEKFNKLGDANADNAAARVYNVFKDYIKQAIPGQRIDIKTHSMHTCSCLRPGVQITDMVPCTLENKEACKRVKVCDITVTTKTVYVGGVDLGNFSKL